MAVLTQFWGLDGLIFLFCGIIGVYLYFTRNFNYWKKRGVKEVPPAFLLGNIGPCILGQKPVINFFQDMYIAGENEPYIGYHVLDKPHLLIRDPELIKYVLIKDFNNFTSRSASAHKQDILGNMNLFAVNNPDWKFIRQKLSPIFTSGRLKKMYELMLEIDKDLNTYMDSLKLEGKGRPVEVKDICGKFTTDLIGITAYGMRFNSLTDPNALLRKVGKGVFGGSYKRYVELLSAQIIPQFVKIFGFSFFGKEATYFLRQIFWEAIDQRMQSGAKRGDLIDLLIDFKKEQEDETKYKGSKIEGDALVAQAAIFFTGGFETSSSTMSFTLYELAKHMEIQQRLRTEIVDAIQECNGKLTYDKIMSGLPYLDMVVSESLRMYPILPFLDRVAENDYQLPGTKLMLQTGSTITIPMHALHMDPNYFSKPDIYDPERFSAENKKNIKPNTYFPFGDGPRICIGMRLGLLQTKLGLINLVSQYEFTPCAETTIPMQFNKLNSMTASKNDIILNVRKLAT